MKTYLYRHTHKIYGGSYLGADLFASLGVLILLEKKPINYPIWKKPISFGDFMGQDRPSREDLETMFPVIIPKYFEVSWRNIRDLSYKLPDLPNEIKFVYEEGEDIKTGVNKKKEKINNEVIYILHDKGDVKRQYKYYGEDSWESVEVLALTKYKPANLYDDFCHKKVMLDLDITKYEDYYPSLVPKSQYESKRKYQNIDGTVGFVGCNSIDIQRDTSDSPGRTIGDYVKEYKSLRSRFSRLITCFKNK